MKLITEKYNDPKNIDTFDDYNDIYAEKIMKKFNKLNQNTVESHEFYNAYFKDFGLKSVEISKLFSTLKHK
jgi:hypothetical protein